MSLATTPRQPLQALPLRDYQEDALAGVAARLAEGMQRPAVVMPTGGGKTVCFGHDSLRHLEAHPGDRVLILVDLDALVDQTVKKIRQIAPGLQVGIVQGKHNDVRADVIVGSVQTLKNPKRRQQITGVGRIIVDECEMAVTASCMAILEHFGSFRPDGPRTIGYTATLMRNDQKSLGAVWQGVAFQRDITWMIRNRYLVNVRGLAVEVPDLDLRNVKATKADYSEGELGEALAESLAPELVAKAILEHASDRKTLMFVPTVAAGHVFATALEDAGIDARVIHGGMGKEERKSILAWHRRGTVLVNCMLLTKGYDDPEVDCIAMGRPTKSKRLYIQIVGRGLRVDPSRPYVEQDCLLLDVVGANETHDLRSIVDLSDKPLKKPGRDETTSLLDLEDEFDAGDGVPDDEVVWYTGETVTREFDPLGQATTTVWLKTRGGTWFVPAGANAYVFICQYPEPGQWSVAWCGKGYADRPMKGNDRPVGMTEHRGLPLDQALVWAAELAESMGADLNTSTKGAPWRKKVASEKMQSFARSLGLKVEGGESESGLFICTERAGALSDRITEVMGSRRIDPLVKLVRGR